MKTWREVNAEARARGHYTVKESKASADWLTCAVGEQHRAMPNVVTYYFHCPNDTGLTRLGCEFCRVVCAHDFDRADSLLDKIEDRVLVLKREQGA